MRTPPRTSRRSGAAAARASVFVPAKATSIWRPGPGGTGTAKSPSAPVRTVVRRLSGTAPGSKLSITRISCPASGTRPAPTSRPARRMLRPLATDRGPGRRPPSRASSAVRVFRGLASTIREPLARSTPELTLPAPS